MVCAAGYAAVDVVAYALIRGRGFDCCTPEAVRHGFGVWPYRLLAKTPGFQSGKRGSKPRGATRDQRSISSVAAGSGVKVASVPWTHVVQVRVLPP